MQGSAPRDLGIEGPLRVALLAPFDPMSSGTWSGTPLAMVTALRDAGIDLTPVAAFSKFTKLFTTAISKGTRGKISLRWNRSFVRLASWSARRKLRDGNYHVILAVACSPVSALMRGWPGVVHISDATPALLRSNYASIKALHPAIQRAAEEAELSSFQTCSAIHYPSQWASTSAIEDYDIDPSRIWVIPWGANAVSKKDFRQRRYEGGAVKLLFIGVDWDRKGGEILLQCSRLLQAQGVVVFTDIVGVSESAARSPIPDGTTFYGRLDHQQESQRELMERLFEQATVFVLPTRAEALGIVFAEAASRGIPSIAYAVGGVPTVVDSGKTGVLLPVEATAEDFAHEIMALLQSSERYADMSAAAIQKYNTELNWCAWANSMAARMKLIAASVKSN